MVLRVIVKTMPHLLWPSPQRPLARIGSSNGCQGARGDLECYTDPGRGRKHSATGKRDRTESRTSLSPLLLCLCSVCSGQTATGGTLEFLTALCSGPAPTANNLTGRLAASPAGRFPRGVSAERSKRPRSSSTQYLL